MTHNDIAQDLLDAASAVLSGHGFTIANTELAVSGRRCVLAENDLFVLGVLAGGDLEDVRKQESEATSMMLALVDRPEVGYKRWDAYLVLLVADRADSGEDARQLVALAYDTRGVRRLVATQVKSGAPGIESVLRPFVPLPPPRGHLVGDAFAELVDELQVNGIQAAEASRIVKAFETTGELGDV